MAQQHRHQALAEPQVAKISGSEGACYGSAVVVQDARNASVLWAFATPNGPAVRPRKHHSPRFTYLRFLPRTPQQQLLVWFVCPCWHLWPPAGCEYTAADTHHLHGNVFAVVR